MATTDDFTPYSTLRAFFPATMPTWIPDELDQQRIESYKIYEEIYWNVPDTFKLVARGTEDKPIYLPSAKTMIETCNRYTATSMKVNIEPTLVDAAISADITAYQQVWNDLFKRERFWSKFAGNKRYGLIRGDWLWRIMADPTKPEGSRISIRELDPASYFPITDPDDVDHIIGCHIVDQVAISEDETELRRATYLKPGSERNPGQYVTYQFDVFDSDADDWNALGKPKRVITPLTTLTGITNLPVYHIKNFDEPANPFGSSEIRGMERIIAAMNQAISDEDLALALDGIGLYETDAPPPTDDNGNVINWRLGPGRVVEHPAGTKFSRVSGVGSFGPFQDHLGFLTKALREGAGTPDIAIGVVDVTVAESGVSRLLQLAPLLARTEEKDTSIVEVHTQMFYDIQHEWLPTYEGISQEGVMVTPVVGNKLPEDVDGRLKQLNDMFDRKIISAQYYRQEASKLGFEFPDGMDAEIIKETTDLATAADPFGDRINSELGGSTNSGQGQTQQGNAS